MRGMSKSRLYNIHTNMHNRCYDNENKDYIYYGEKGICVCQYWNSKILTKKESFENFAYWALRNGYNDNLTLHRIDNQNHYMPNNCIWADDFTQSRNKSNNVLYKFQGEEKILIDWTVDDRCVIKNIRTLRKRIEMGWDIEKAFTIPVDKRYSRTS